MLHWLASKAKGTGRVPQRCLSLASGRLEAAAVEVAELTGVAVCA